MLAYITLVKWALFAELSQLRVERIVTTDLYRQRLASLELHADRPDADLELDDITRRDVLNAVVRMEGDILVCRLRSVNVAMGSAKHADRSREEHDALRQILSWNIVEILDLSALHGTADMRQGVSVLVELAQHDVDIHVVVIRAGHVKVGFGNAHQAGCLVELDVEFDMVCPAVTFV